MLNRMNMNGKLNIGECPLQPVLNFRQVMIFHMEKLKALLPRPSFINATFAWNLI